jgi:hypothetical protein
MDILNWLHIKRQQLIRTTLDSPQDLVVLGADVSFQKRGDKYQSYAMPAEDFVSSVITAVPFNPLFTDAGGLLAGVTSIGSYTLIGNICYFRVYVDFAGCTNFGTTQYQITLPFASVETMRQAGGTLHQTTGASLYHIAGITDIAVSTTIHKLYYSGSTTDLAWKNTTPVGATTITSHFDISGVYQIA